MGVLKIIAPENIDEIGWLVILASLSAFTYSINLLCSIPIIIIGISWYFFLGRMSHCCVSGNFYVHQSRFEEMRGIRYTYAIDR